MATPVSTSERRPRNRERGSRVAVDSSGVDAALSAKGLGAANVAVGVNAGVDLGAVSSAPPGFRLGGGATDNQLGASLDLGGGTGVALDTGSASALGMSERVSISARAPASTSAAAA
jgi:hypothetical protein